MAESELHPESLIMSLGYDPQRSEGSIKPPIFPTSTYVFKSAEEGEAFFEIATGKRLPREAESIPLAYSRFNHPNLEILEGRLTSWDGAESCAVCASGMAAITAAFLTFLNRGDIVLYAEPLYGGTDKLLKDFLPKKFGVDAVELTDLLLECLLEGQDSVTAKLEKRVSVIFIETPANPTNKLIDIVKHVKLARTFEERYGRKVRVIVDNTFLGPLFQHPLKLGADMVVYSATKYIGGHSDLIAGACLGSKQDIVEVKKIRALTGSMADTFTSWLLLRSLETLKMRMTAQMKNARYVADFLRDNPKVEKVYYLGHIPDVTCEYAIYKTQCLAAGAMISFDVKGGKNEAFRFLNALKLIQCAVSLGSNESLAEHPFTMTHAGVSDADKGRFGITDKMIRLSVGIEHFEDIIEDLSQALTKV